MRLEIALALLIASPRDEPAAAPVGEAVVGFARENLGRPVGDGQCTDLVHAAYDAAGAEPPRHRDGEPTWGDPVEARADLRPGDVIQFRDVVFQGRRRSRGGFVTYRTRFPRHAAIVERVLDGGRRLVILHQNAGPADAPESERHLVRRDTLIMADLRPGGTLTFHRPRPASPPASVGR
jgi:hypothetical protein